jgi:hypothetical protein
MSLIEYYITMKFVREEKSTGHDVESYHSPSSQGAISLWLRLPKHDTTSQALGRVRTRAFPSSSPVLLLSNIVSTHFLLDWYLKGRKEAILWIWSRPTQQ